MQGGSGQWVYGNSVLSVQFCCDPKIALKNKSFFKRQFTQANSLNFISLKNAWKYVNYQQSVASK